MTAIPSSWTVSALAGSLGAEIHGPALAGVTPAEVEAIKQLLHDHLVIFFPGQSPTPEEQITSADTWQAGRSSEPDQRPNAAA